jgi:hypothetical protein
MKLSQYQRLKLPQQTKVLFTGLHAKSKLWMTDLCLETTEAQMNHEQLQARYQRLIQIETVASQTASAPEQVAHLPAIALQCMAH